MNSSRSARPEGALLPKRRKLPDRSHLAAMTITLNWRRKKSFAAARCISAMAAIHLAAANDFFLQSSHKVRQSARHLVGGIKRYDVARAGNNYQARFGYFMVQTLGIL